MEGGTERSKAHEEAAEHLGRGVGPERGSQSQQSGPRREAGKQRTGKKGMGKGGNGRREQSMCLTDQVEIQPGVVECNTLGQRLDIGRSKL